MKLIIHIPAISEDEMVSQGLSPEDLKAMEYMKLPDREVWVPLRHYPCEGASIEGEIR